MKRRKKIPPLLRREFHLRLLQSLPPRLLSNKLLLIPMRRKKRKKMMFPLLRSPSNNNNNNKLSLLLKEVKTMRPTLEDFHIMLLLMMLKHSSLNVEPSTQSTC